MRETLGRQFPGANIQANVDCLLRGVTALALLTNGGRPARYASLGELLRAMRYDFNVVASINERRHELRTINQPLLLLGGDSSPDYLKNALQR